MILRRALRPRSRKLHAPRTVLSNLARRVVSLWYPAFSMIGSTESRVKRKMLPSRQRVLTSSAAGGWQADDIIPSRVLTIELRRTEEQLREHMAAAQLQAQHHEALFHHTEALASELRAARAEISELQKQAQDRTGLINRQEALEALVHDTSARATQAKQHAARTEEVYQDELDDREAALRRTVRALQRERETVTTLRRELEAAEGRTRSVHIKMQEQEEELEKQERERNVWRQKAKEWRGEKATLVSQTERTAQNLALRKEELHFTRTALIRENHRLRQVMDGGASAHCLGSAQEMSSPTRSPNRSPVGSPLRAARSPGRSPPRGWSRRSSSASQQRCPQRRPLVDTGVDLPARHFPPPPSFSLGLSPRSPRSPDPMNVHNEEVMRDWRAATERTG